VISLSIKTRPSYSVIKKELFRKLIHIFGFSIPFISIIMGIPFAASLIIVLVITYTVSEYFRLKGRSILAFTTITRIAMRDDNGHESQSTLVKEPVYFAAGILAALLIFPAPFNYAAIAVVTLGDGFSSIIGRLYGRNKIPYSGGKTLEGTAAGLAFAFAGCLIFVSPPIALIAASIGMITELLQLRVSDNLSIPLISGLALTIIGTL
jgi:dolichol kinase